MAEKSLEYDSPSWREASWYSKSSNGSVVCRLCPHFCSLQHGERGLCQVRENRHGMLYTRAYGTALKPSVDPVEKKPLYHFFPGSKSFSLTAAGCNFHCSYCINWEISQAGRPTIAWPALAPSVPQNLVDDALERGCQSFAYTFVEPTIFLEYVREVARPARAAGLLNIFKTNGYMTSEAIDECRDWLDAANIDLKSFRDATYQAFGGRLQPVLQTIRALHQAGVWLEITTLLVPGLNDSPKEIADMADFVADELGPETPWHLLRFFPAFRMEKTPTTPLETLELARQLGTERGLRHIYFSNLLLRGRQDTYCSGCGEVLVQRSGHHSVASKLVAGKCMRCQRALSGVFDTRF